jgi:hypothetical protein
MLDSSTNKLLPSTLSAALSGYGIDFMSGIYLKSMDIRATSNRQLASSIQLSFSNPSFNPNTNTITVPNIFINSAGNYGAIYFVLVKYK